MNHYVLMLVTHLDEKVDDSHSIAAVKETAHSQ